MVMSKIETIETKLRHKGLRATAQRLMIYQAIEDAGHIDIDSLYDVLKKKIPSLSLATIYKNMHSLVGKEIITEVSIAGQKTMYEVSIDNHVHHVCEKCGHVEDIRFNTMELLDSIQELAGKNISDCKLTVFGTCTNCSN
jgi:Fur family peroxide stress response transcriptional regulator